MSATGGYALAVGGLDILSGIFGMLGAQEAARSQRARAELVRVETEAEIQRYRERAQAFKASQKLAFIKSGVQISGSALDVLTDTALTASENISAMRSAGGARALAFEQSAVEMSTKGRGALVSGFTGAAGTAFKYAEYSRKIDGVKTQGISTETAGSPQD